MLFDIYSLLITIAVALLCVLIGIWGGFKIAKKSGSFNKPLLDVSLMNESLLRESKPLKQVIFGYSVNDHDIANCRLPLRISNDGDLSAKEVIIELIFPKFLKIGQSDDVVHYELTPDIYDKSLMTRKSSDMSGFHHVWYTFPRINPGQSLRIYELVDVVRASGVPFKVDAVTKDVVPITVEGRVVWSSRIHICISATDIPVVRTHFEIRSYQGQNKEEVGKKLMEEETRVLREWLFKNVKNAQKEVIESLYASGLRKKAMIVIPKLRKITEAENRGYYEEVPEESERYIIESDPSMDIDR